MDKPTTTKTSTAKYGTVIKVCTCNNEYQDNPKKKSKGNPHSITKPYRCYTDTR